LWDKKDLAVEVADRRRGSSRTRAVREATDARDGYLWDLIEKLRADQTVNSNAPQWIGDDKLTKVYDSRKRHDRHVYAILEGSFRLIGDLDVNEVKKLKGGEGFVEIMAEAQDIACHSQERIYWTVDGTTPGTLSRPQSICS
jgi:hypothetical protein